MRFKTVAQKRDFIRNINLIIAGIVVITGIVLLIVQIVKRKQLREEQKKKYKYTSIAIITLGMIYIVLALLQLDIITLIVYVYEKNNPIKLEKIQVTNDGQVQRRNNNKIDFKRENSKNLNVYNNKDKGQLKIMFGDDEDILEQKKNQ